MFVKVLRLVCLCTPLAFGQVGVGGVREGMGRLSGEVQPRSENVRVELYQADSPTPVDRTETGLTGRFSFENLPKGDYRVRVTDGYGNILAEDYARVTGIGDSVTIRLPSSDSERQPVNGTVSLNRLQRAEVPKKARKEFQKALKAAENGDSETAVLHLQKAVDICPEFTEAQNNLGVRLIFLGRNEEAVQHFERAIDLDPGSPEPYSNLAMVWLRMDRVDDALRAAREAVRLNPGMPKNRYLLGLAMSAAGDASGAEHYLRSATAEFPASHIALAQLLAEEGRRSEAAEELRTYLASGNNLQHRDLAGKWLATLEGRGTPAVGGSQ